MLITNKLQHSPTGGREMLCKLNHDLLRDLYGGRLAVIELEKRPVRGFAGIMKAFRGYIDGLDEEACDLVVNTIEARNVDKVFIDGSNFGELAKTVARRFPNIQIITFFHNVEARFFWGALKRSRSLRALGVLAANYLAERKSVRHSDKIVSLSSRDSRLLRKLYGRGATHVSPIALQDKLPEQANGVRGQAEPFVLFVGGTFYANRDGMAWFVENVVPYISMKTVVVGKGFEIMKDQLEREGKVLVVGTVDSLAEWYLKASVVVAPIFDGSGMKTKVAEALMHGKEVIGTPEAFSGYEAVADKAGWVCATAKEFVEAIATVQGRTASSFVPELRTLYEENYSFNAARSRFAEILEPTGSHRQWR
jgi:glycosyltransferase involved in cell wall biosynthesis